MFNSGIYLKIKEVARKLFKLEKDMGNEVGLKRSEAQVISYLAEKEHLAHSEIVTLCEADKSAVSRILTNMEKKGLIQSNHTTNNKKSLYATLTETGKEMANKLQEAFEKHIIKHFGKLSKKDKNAIKNLAL